MHCLYCHYFDKNDTFHACGTCEPQDKDFPCTHACNLTKEQVKELENLTGHPRETTYSHQKE